MKPCLNESHLSLRPVTMATGCAQYTGEGGDGGAETMATEADGEGCLSLKEQEPLLKLMTCVIFSQTTTSFLTSKKNNVAMPLRRGGKAIVLP